MNEKEYRKKIDKHLEGYFEVEREVYSQNKKRIDYILKCKASSVLFGVEVKSTQHMTGVDIGKYIIQASGYYYELWKTKFSDKPVRLQIFITPAISNFIKQIKPETKKVITSTSGNVIEYYESFHSSDHEHSNVNSMLAAFNIGEIRKINNEFKFIYANKVIWSSYKTPNCRLHKNNFDFYNKKLNSK